MSSIQHFFQNIQYLFRLTPCTVPLVRSPGAITVWGFAPAKLQAKPQSGLALRPSRKSLSLSSSWVIADKFQAAWRVAAFRRQFQEPATINLWDKKLCLPHYFIHYFGQLQL
jgi:hypothetical protein